MNQIKPRLKTAAIALLVLSVVAVASLVYSLEYSNTAAYGQMSSPGYSVNIASKPGLGSYLTNATGFTLYTFALDIPSNGTSRCTGNCLENWPAFYVTSLTLPSELNANSFTVITRPDGGKQLAYDGWPLYYFRYDAKPGDTNGQGIAKLWSVCTLPTPFATITSTTTASTSTTTRAGGGW